jgi:hypothetical protein
MKESYATFKQEEEEDDPRLGGGWRKDATLGELIPRGQINRKA